MMKFNVVLQNNADPRTPSNVETNFKSAIFTLRVRGRMTPINGWGSALFCNTTFVSTLDGVRGSALFCNTTLNRVRGYAKTYGTLDGVRWVHTPDHRRNTTRW